MRAHRFEVQGTVRTWLYKSTMRACCTTYLSVLLEYLCNCLNRVATYIDMPDFRISKFNTINFAPYKCCIVLCTKFFMSQQVV